MGTQGTGRKRSTKKDRSTAEDDALNLIAREAEARLAAKRAARAEAREIRMKELERQQKELSDDDERMSVGSRGSVRVEDRDYLEKGSRAASALTAGTLTSLGGTSSRRGSGETAITVDAETSIREIKEIHELKDQIQDVEIKYTQNLKEAKDALAEVEEKYRKAMVSNAQLDNEKNNLMYQVDTLKDSLMELEELLSESQRGYEEKVKEFEREKHAHSVLQFQFNELKETLKQSEELLNEIRQLKMKQEGFGREISDLQETVEWKDKKIAALERQKEYTDAIRIERDDLREEVVKLKDILKKHGIVLGPDLSINGDVGDAEVDGSPGADPASQPTPDSQTSPTEGNSMLGNTEETQLRSSREEEVDPEQHQEIFEEENHLSSDPVCNVAGVSTVETPSEEQPTEEQQTCLETEEDNVEESDLNLDINVDINEHSVTEAKDVIVCCPGLQGDVTSSEENGPETETPEVGDVVETSKPDLGETESKSVDTHSDDIRESSNIFEEQENKPEDVEESNLRITESCHQQKVTQDVMKENVPDESVAAVSSTEPQQEPENVEEAENDEAEETPSKSQPQGAASGKKKRKKRRGKKKGGTHEEKKQQKAETEKGKTEKDTESATRDNGPTTEPDIDGSVTETVQQSGEDQGKNEQDSKESVDRVEAVKASETFSHNETLKESVIDHVTDEHVKEQTDNVEEIEAVIATETFSHIETLREMRVEHVTEEHNQEQSLEAVEAVEEETSTETSCHIETLKESQTDPEKDEQDKEQSLETEVVEAVAPAETIQESSTDPKTDKQDEEQTLEKETVEEVEAVAPAETVSHVETIHESINDPKTDEQDGEQTLETDKVQEVESVSSPAPEVNFSTPDLVNNSNSVENIDGLEKVCTSSVDDFTQNEADILSNGNVIHTESETIVSAEDEVVSIDEMKSESTTNDPENTSETNSKENTEAESLVPNNDDIPTDESESTINSEDKENMLVSLSPTEGITDGLSGSELPSGLSAAVNSDSDNTPTELSDQDPEEATETVKDDEEPVTETEQESFSPGVTSPAHDGDNSELKPDRTEKEELNGDLREPEGLVDLSSREENSDSCDSALVKENTDGSDTEKSLLETVAPAELLVDVENQTLQCDNQIDDTNAEVSSGAEEIDTTDMLTSTDSPKEATENGCSIEQDHGAEESVIAEDPELKNSQNDQQSETQLHEPSKDTSEDNDSSQPTLQDSEEEDGDDEEGQSFDFDDMDIEMALTTNPPENLKQEEVEEGVEVASDESNHDSSGLSQSNTESNENTQDEPGESNEEKCTVDGSNQADTLDKEMDTVPHVEAKSEEGENVCEQQKNTPEEEAADEPVIEERKVLIVGELGVVADNINQAVPLPVEKELDVIKQEMQGGDLVVPKGSDQVASNKEPQQTKKDVRKNSKKGKAKGKEDCKMS